VRLLHARVPAHAQGAQGRRPARQLGSEEEIRHGLDGNVCRCTGYRSILDAARDIAGLGGEQRA
jgi:xanthine dehydrogenase iron-sulfur cluster and FAD-binding subunit A